MALRRRGCRPEVCDTGDIFGAGGRCWDCTNATSDDFGEGQPGWPRRKPLLLAKRHVLIEQQQRRQLPPRFDQIGERVRIHSARNASVASRNTPRSKQTR
jgi:hypothetical protein